MTVRKACALANQLPQGAQTFLSLGSDASWSNETHLLALVVDTLNAGNWQRAGDANAARPVPLLRPSGAAAQEAAHERLLDRARRFRERHKMDGDA
jgi:hypothetical protein